ncbi:MAG: BREX-1 system adenine-specific DNA-methyltransferase PglX [Desulfobacteraceae bacterium]|nr:BREX-1 system adenine-specific DNA-methyltransferase PglX [Desulfobacteraceae bacterium]
MGETGDAYRCFLFSLFDEFSLDLAVLFDRHSVQGRLFPREAALLALLDQINHFEIEPFWAEDETIGWIYQYFNSQEERKQMRKASQAPRNSRELAVRNQFFTPRYVVEFLTDNTLGRIWYDMTRGHTALKDLCRYLVRRPNEIFLAAGETAPETAEENLENLSQEELLKQPVYVPFRRLKDPRELRMLDPACGSMHFGLYAFDLFETIYEEAWHIETDLGPDVFDRSTHLKPLQETFTGFDEFKKVIPQLIIEQNIHGVDIDPRAVQIAGLSLWQRAQRAWHQMGIKSGHRPAIRKSNIVCAEPMPGEKEMLREFTATIFDKMHLAGEAGTLLKIEQEITSAISDAKEAYNNELLRKKEQEGFLPGMAPKREPTLFDFAELHHDGDFWETAEEKILTALQNYAAQAESHEGQKRLFAEDAAKGFAFIDLCRKRFDVVLMNPPFGEPCIQTSELLQSKYGEANADVDAAFVDRSLDFLQQAGQIGGIYNRTQFFKGYLSNWRDRNLLVDRQIEVCIDLGLGVLDGAMVEAAAYVTSPANNNRPAVFITALSFVDKETAVIDGYVNVVNGTIGENCRVVPPILLLQLPAHRISYWVAYRLLKAFREHQALEGTYGYARQGLITSDNERFLRLIWEIPIVKLSCASLISINDGNAKKQSHNWFPYAKGGDYSPYFGDIHLAVNWGNNGREICNFFRNGRLASRPQNRSFYFDRALTYTERTASDISPRAMPDGCIFDCKGPIVAASVDQHQLYGLLALLNSRTFKYFVELFLAGGDSSVSVGAARQFTQSIVGSVPVPKVFSERHHKLGDYAKQIWNNFAEKNAMSETSRFYCTMIHEKFRKNQNIRQSIYEEDKENDSRHIRILALSKLIEDLVNDLYELDLEALKEIKKVCGEHPNQFENGTFIELQEEEQIRVLRMPIEEIISDLRGQGNVPRSITKMCYSADRWLEVLSINYLTRPDIIIRQKQKFGIFDPNRVAERAVDLLNYLFGLLFGRWDIRFATGERHPPKLPDPFDPLTICPPGMFQNDKGLPGEKKDVPFDYPIRITWHGILVDDEGHIEDVGLRVRESIEVVWKERTEVIEQELCVILNVKTLREYFRRPLSFFTEHLKRYSKSRRQAPIYWPLQTPSCSYTLWIYYHRLTDQTLYTCVNDFVEPKLKTVMDNLTALRNQTTRSSAEEKDLVRLTDLESELKDFRDELLRIAGFWKPDLNDGVQITASPLWKLFQHRQWQKKLKDTWKKLETGEYDWAHLACSIWPERVLRKCHSDRSLAIAHDVENDFWEEMEVPVIRRGKDTGKTKLEWHPKPLTEDRLQELIHQKMAAMRSSH